MFKGKQKMLVNGLAELQMAVETGRYGIEGDVDIDCLMDDLEELLNEVRDLGEDEDE